MFLTYIYTLAYHMGLTFNILYVFSQVFSNQYFMNWFQLQDDVSSLAVNFDAYDAESDVQQLRIQILTTQHGTTRQIFPGNKKWFCVCRF